MAAFNSFAFRGSPSTKRARATPSADPFLAIGRILSSEHRTRKKNEQNDGLLQGAEERTRGASSEAPG